MSVVTIISSVSLKSKPNISASAMKYLAKVSDLENGRIDSAFNEKSESGKLPSSFFIQGNTQSLNAKRLSLSSQRV